MSTQTHTTHTTGRQTVMSVEFADAFEQVVLDKNIGSSPPAAPTSVPLGTVSWLALLGEGVLAAITTSATGRGIVAEASVVFRAPDFDPPIALA